MLYTNLYNYGISVVMVIAELRDAKIFSGWKEEKIDRTSGRQYSGREKRGVLYKRRLCR